MSDSTFLTAWRRNWLMVVLPVVAAAMFVYVFVEFVIFDPREAKVRALCDRAVEALLTSNDLIEVTRAGIVVRYMNCSVSRRL